MARIETTIWDLAKAICDEADGAGYRTDEAERLSAAALAHALQRALLVDRAAEEVTPVRVRQPALDLAI